MLFLGQNKVKIGARGNKAKSSEMKTLPLTRLRPKGGGER